MMRKLKLLTAAIAALALVSCNGVDKGPPKGEAIAKVSAPDGKAWSDVVAKTDEGYKMGNAAAKLQLVEYGAISCPVCSKFSIEGEADLRAMVDSGVLAFEFRPFLIHGIQDVPGFLLAQCNGKDAYFGLMENLFRDQESWIGNLQKNMTQAEYEAAQSMKPLEAASVFASKMGLVDYVKARGVSEENAKKCLADKTVLDAMAKVTEARGKDGTVRGTPTLILNGSPLGVTAWSAAKNMLVEAGAR